MSRVSKANTFTTTGLCDLQVNGFSGVDYNDPASTPEAIEQSMVAMFTTGVTQCLPTVITASLERQRDCLMALEAARSASALCRQMMVGYHLEGPFLNPEPGYCGCHPSHEMVDASWDYVERLQEAAGGHIRMMTVAPERPGVMALIPRLVKAGITVAIGHSAADYDTLQAAMETGARLSTHLGNGTAATLPKSDNVILSQLSMDGLSASFIADGYHVRRHALRVFLRAKQASRTLLVTDGTAASAAGPGHYTLGTLKIERGNDPVVHKAGTESLAGSAATLNACVCNVVNWYGIDPMIAIDWAGDRARAIISLDEELYGERTAGTLSWAVDDKGPRITRVHAGDYAVQPDS